MQAVQKVDPNLFIVHYGPAEQQDRIPIAHIPVDPRVQNMMAQRMSLQRNGQIVRKEFMLSDKSNWPRIPLPRDGRGQPMYPTPPNPRGVPQQMAYPPHTGGPPNKRARHAASAQQQPMMGSMMGMESAYDDEEDVSRGDPFDISTPREVSMLRYQQNHEWMEEIISSPYRLGQILHADLGLGLQGELNSLTEGIFEAQDENALTTVPKKPYIGHLDPEMAEEFRKRVNEKIKSTEAEIEEMKAKHAKQLARFNSNSFIKHAEQDIRYSVQDTGPEFWRLEGRYEDGGDDGAAKWNSKQHKKVEDIVTGVEQALNYKIRDAPDVTRVQDGGYQEPAPDPIPEPVLPTPIEPEEPVAATVMSRGPSQTGSQYTGVMPGDSDIDMGGTAGGLMDQIGGFSAHSTPGNFPTPQPALSALASSVATPAGHGNVPSPHPHPPTIKEDAMEDVVEKAEQGREAAPATEGDWVVVPRGGVSPGLSNNSGADAAPKAEESMTTTATEAPQAAAVPPAKSAEGTPGADSMGFDADHFSSLDDLDTAGDALAGYDPPALDGAGAVLGDGLDMTMDMEGSAFGDAFHGVSESRDSGADTPADHTM